MIPREARMQKRNEKLTASKKVPEEHIRKLQLPMINESDEEDGIIIGITNMDEFAAGSSTETSMYGYTDNPAAPGRIPGGSSGGSAAAVAANMCDISLGSDT